ncbi:MAG: arginase family protein [Chitinophagaceae bacterium]
MASLTLLADFLEPLNLFALSDDEGYQEGQLGTVIKAYEEEFPDLDDADIILLGCGEQRGTGRPVNNNAAPDAIRKQFYQLHYWHRDMVIADIGNVKTGASLNDTYAALYSVLQELIAAGKTIVILGGSHDLTLAQYKAYANLERVIEAVCVDARIDLAIDSVHRNDNFLMEMLTSEPNFIRHFSHVGFQSYLVQPRMLETLDKLRFDCYRVGHVKERPEEMEPVIRHASLFSFDVAAIAHAYAPVNRITPNGFNGEEACVLMRQAGLSPWINTIGIYGYDPAMDVQDMTAKQIAHMLWYVVDGRFKGKNEAPLSDETAFNAFHLAFAEVEATFLQSKKTGRWWMQLPDKRYIACSYHDYLVASNNDIPERWLRAMERG